jgi:hypothetical protein
MKSDPEARAIAKAQASEIAALSWVELDGYGDRDETIAAPSGRKFRVKSRVYWDMDEWASGINISVKLYPRSGLRRIWGYKAFATRGGPNDPVPPRPAS